VDRIPEGVLPRATRAVAALLCDTDMRAHPEPSTQEVLAGLVERVTYHNSENGFCVLRAKVRGTLKAAGTETLSMAI
jgi:hypothetical protein